MIDSIKVKRNLSLEGKNENMSIKTHLGHWSTVFEPNDTSGGPQAFIGHNFRCYWLPPYVRMCLVTLTRKLSRAKDSRSKDLKMC